MLNEPPLANINKKNNNHLSVINKNFLFYMNKYLKRHKTKHNVTNQDKNF